MNNNFTKNRVQLHNQIIRKRIIDSKLKGKINPFGSSLSGLGGNNAFGSIADLGADKNDGSDDLFDTSFTGTSGDGCLCDLMKSGSVPIPPEPEDTPVDENGYAILHPDSIPVGSTLTSVTLNDCAGTTWYITFDGTEKDVPPDNATYIESYISATDTKTASMGLGIDGGLPSQQGNAAVFQGHNVDPWYITEITGNVNYARISYRAAYEVGGKVYWPPIADHTDWLATINAYCALYYTGDAGIRYPDPLPTEEYPYKVDCICTNNGGSLPYDDVQKFNPIPYLDVGAPDTRQYGTAPQWLSSDVQTTGFPTHALVAYFNGWEIDPAHWGSDGGGNTVTVGTTNYNGSYSVTAVRLTDVPNGNPISGYLDPNNTNMFFTARGGNELTFTPDGTLSVVSYDGGGLVFTPRPDSLSLCDENGDDMDHIPLVCGGSALINNTDNWARIMNADSVVVAIIPPSCAYALHRDPAQRTAMPGSCGEYVSMGTDCLDSV
jgi:hypothetical protein